MNFSRPYKTFAAAFLLLLYAFIATPVQLWHNHAEVSLVCTDTKGNKVSSHAGSSSESNCNICSHHYSVYMGNDPIVFSSPAVVFPLRQAMPFCAIPLLPFADCTGRGPPAILS